MYKFCILTFLLCCLSLSGCVQKTQPKDNMASYNSDKMNKLKTTYYQYTNENEQNVNKKYTYENNVLKINMQ